MKKNLLYLLMLVCSVSLFTSCGDDDDDKVNVAGTYAGNLAVAINGGSPISSSQNIELTSPAEGKINFILKNFILQSDATGGEGTLPVGNIKITDIDLVGNGGNFTFMKKVEKLKIEAGDQAGIEWVGPGLSDAGIPVTLSGTITGNNIKLDIDIPFTEFLKIAVQFSGTKK
ncbi:calycin-like domain-containing protein [Bacteroides sp.]|uniref:calycin-like domain-containing protein n=1 Tax=Bacteroides sp. TaxID=29523 RepID=UPI00262FCDB3|nr:calycin-like domain-containing protein [Bacteroides sp.]MDD3040383.1 calycin-like domain-containing protein [Bacteroides sp.]